MNKWISRRGFSLVELLTVIAIIAILAAIIFPVMSAVKSRAREQQCMTNLHQIAMGVQMFKQDNHRYPLILGSEVYSEPDSNGRRTKWVDSPQTPDMFENVKDQYLFPEYVKSYQIFHCPAAQTTNSRDVAWYDLTGNSGGTSTGSIAVYAYDSYDCFVRGAGRDQSTYKQYRESDDQVERHYYIDWVPRSVSPDQADEWIRQSGLKPYPPNSVQDTPALRIQDYARQLRFRNPPGDTVVTWCSYHAGADGMGKVLVVFLDGSTSSIPGREVMLCKWRLRPKKS